ncbi:MAG: MBL fold metallo-hydrolase [Bacteroidetes bacterium]|nr:MAG: MBL fold metallo-hydrolase [Bacteroidota bacterium]
MKVEQIYTGCLAEAAYYIESNGEAAVIDPLRDIEDYLKRAEEGNAKIKYIFLSHFHADFMAGHQDLANKTGGTIVIGPTEAPIGYEAHIAKDNEIFKLGDVELKVLHTPGHTTESMCLLLSDENGKDTGLFSGDTLFIGDVGRPDLAQKVVADLTQDKLARMLFHSLRNKIMPLDDDIIVYPNHGAGSPCGKNMSSETTDTLGNQKKTNYALRPDQTEDEFVKELLTGLKEPPSYFPAMVLGNIKGTESIYDVRERENNAMSADEFEKAAETEGVAILDTRASTKFVNGFVPNAINIDIDSNFAVWAGTILRDVNTKILVVTYPGREQEVIDRLARVGFDHVIGFLSGGHETWKAAGKAEDTLKSVTPESVAELEGLNYLDVRRESEYDSEHIVDAVNAPLDYHWSSIDKVDKDKTYHVYCRSGNRSVIYASILKAQGFNNLIDIAGGIEEMKKTGKFEVTEYVCPSTML